MRRGRKVADPPQPTSHGDGQVWFDFIGLQLTAERDRRTSLDARATAILSTSRIFFTAVFAGGAFALGKDYKASGLLTVLPAVGLGNFVLAAVLALIAGALREYRVAEIASWRLMTADQHWFAPADSARQDLAALNATTVATLRHSNEIKVRVLIGAIAFQLVALAILGIALVAAVLQRRSGFADRRAAQCEPPTATAYEVAKA